MSEFEAKESSNLHWARYDASRRVLQVDFKNKAGAKASTYEYANFPEELYAQFHASDSKGRFFAYHIRPNFTGVKVWP